MDTIHIFSYVDVAGGSRGLGDGDGDGDGGGVPTTLPSGQTPGPSRPGTKYPLRGQSLTSIKITIPDCNTQLALKKKYAP